MAWVVGRRDPATCRQLWEQVKRPDCQYFTDDYDAYLHHIPPEQHVVGKRGTQRIESNNANTRHRLARFVRRTRVVSRSVEMIDLSLRLWAWLEIPQNYQTLQKQALAMLM